MGIARRASPPPPSPPPISQDYKVRKQKKIDKAIKVFLALQQPKISPIGPQITQNGTENTIQSKRKIQKTYKIKVSNSYV